MDGVHVPLQLPATPKLGITLFTLKGFNSDVKGPNVALHGSLFCVASAAKLAGKKKV